MTAVDLERPFVVADVDPDDRPAWLAWRRGGIGASDAAALLDISPWASPLSVYSDKIADDEPDDDDAEHLRWGRLLEDPILDEFERRTGLVVELRQVPIECAARRYMRATLDGVAGHPAAETVAAPGRFLADALGPVEVKVSGDHQPWPELPEHYLAQVQWQLAVSGYRRGWVVALFSGRRAEVYEVDADDELADALAAIAEEFWGRVLDRRPPPADGHRATTDALRRLYPGDTDADPVVVSADLVAEVRAARQAAAIAKDAKDAAENVLRAALGDSTTAVVVDAAGLEVPVATWRPQVRRGWDADALAGALGYSPDDPHVQHYRTATPSRVLRLK
jgi:putative phage-type endonuclease